MSRFREWLLGGPVPLKTLMLIVAIWVTESVGYQLTKTFLPTVISGFGVGAEWAATATELGLVLGLLAWILAGTRGGGRSWVLTFAATMATGGVLSTFAPNVDALLAGSALMGLSVVGGGVLMGSICEPLESADARERLFARVRTVTEFVTPGVLWLLGLLRADRGLRTSMTTGLVAFPAAALTALLLARRIVPPTPTQRRGRVRFRRTLTTIWEQYRVPALGLAAGASALTTMATAPYFALLALAVTESGISQDTVPALIAVGTFATLIGFFWKELFGDRPYTGIAVSFVPAILGWLNVLVVELAGASWSVAVKTTLWGVSSLLIRWSQFTSSIVATNVSLSIEEGALAPGTLSVRNAIQSIPGALAGMTAVGIATSVLDLGGGFAPFATAAILLLVVAWFVTYLAYRANRPARAARA
jgi:hypothetical protein